MENTIGDTICAIATPPGIGGIAVIRVSGARSIEICDNLWRGRKLADCESHTAHLGKIGDIDQGVATIFRAPNSFTGEDVVELSVHGGEWVQRETLTELVQAGCRIAQPGEFSRRAFLSGRMDLTQVEATADLIAARSKAQAHAAKSQMRGDLRRMLDDLRDKLLTLASLLELELDFSDQDVEFADRCQLLSLTEETLRIVTDLASSFKQGRALREGIPVAIVGRPNAGKSTLLNALLRDDRAIVSDIPGTTRDTVEDTIEINGMAYRIIDTAGLRSSDNPVERMGIDRSLNAVANASIILMLTTPTDTDDDVALLVAEVESRRQPDATLLHILNKADLLAEPHPATAHTSHGLKSQSGHTKSFPFSLIPTTRHDTESQSEPTKFLPFPPISSTLNFAESKSGIATPIPISATDGASARQIVEEAIAKATRPIDSQAVIITNARHHEALLRAARDLERVRQGLDTQLPPDLIAQDLRQSLTTLGTITGQISTPDILHNIFSHFCIGK